MATPNALKHIVNPVIKQENFVVQVIEIKKMQGDNLLLIVSDGNQYMEALLNPVQSALIESGAVKENQLVMIDDYTVSGGEKPTLNIISLQPREMCGKVGTPTPLKNSFLNDIYTPISALSSFLPDWTIRAKVSHKSELTEYQSKKTGRSERLLSVVLVDSEKNQISGCFFAEAAEKYFNIIEEGKIYLFSNGTVALNEQKYRTVNNYKLLLGLKSVITVDPNQDWTFVNPEKPLVKIAEIPNLREKSLIDIAGVVTEVGLTTDKVTKNGKTFTQRSLKVLDNSGASIDLVLWNEQATDPRISTITPSSTIVLARGVVISTYNGGISLSTSRNLTEITYDPNVPAINELRLWLSSTNPSEIKNIELSEKKEGRKSELSLKNIAEIRGMAPNPNDRYELIACIRYIKFDETTSLTYSACVGCKKKITQDSTDFYNCNSCQRSNKDCMHRYLLRSLQIADFTGMLYTTAFNEVGEVLLQMRAEEFHNKSLEEKKEIINRVQNHSYCFSIKVMPGTSQDGSQRTEYLISFASHINYAESTKKILGIIANSSH